MSNRIQFFFYVLVLLILAGIPAVLYQPGLSGGFFLDDYPNLQALKTYADNGLFYYLAQGGAGPLGRPVAMMSFLLDDYTWPASATNFLTTNLAIHILCGLSVFWLVLKLGELLDLGNSRSLWVAFGTALIWLIHPINISTVLYTIQRMTQLATLFGLWAIIAYIYARMNINKNTVTLKTIVLLAAVPILVLLSVMSKENGLLVLVLIILVDSAFSWKISAPNPKWFDYWRKIFVFAPLVGLAIYLATKAPAFISSYGIRDFTLGQRLLTEARILIHYLGSILLPFNVQSTLFYDDFTISKNVFQPITTLISILSIAVTVTFLWMYRKKLRIAYFSVMWFLGGHILESTVIPLELYFEHRNYMPSIGIIFGCVYGVSVLFTIDKYKNWKIPVALVAMVTVIYTGMLSSLIIKVWGSPNQLIYTWAHYKPGSYRAQSEFSQLLALQGFSDTSIKILKEFSEKSPDNITIRARLASYECQYRGSISQRNMDYFFEEKQQYSVNRDEVYPLFLRYIRLYRAQVCDNLSLELMARLFYDIKNHPHVKSSTRYLAILSYVQGNFIAELGDYDQAITMLDKASDLQRTVDVPLRQATLALRFGRLDEMRKYLDIAWERDKSRSWKYPSRASDILAIEKAYVTLRAKEPEK